MTLPGAGGFYGADCVRRNVTVTVMMTGDGSPLMIVGV